jgi:SAM-dependent methyltransferase
VGRENVSGHPLSSSDWLDAHHRAKLPERSLFARELADYRPARIVDVGCGTGLWLDLLDAHLPSDCEFIGLDADSGSIELAERRADAWARDYFFQACNVEEDTCCVPKSDLLLLFNLLPYLPKAASVLRSLHGDGKLQRVVVRQYGTDTIRIGPMASNDRVALNASLRASIEERGELSHHDLDRAYELARASGLTVEKVSFELTQRHAPFSPEFSEYFKETVNWMTERLSVDASTRLRSVCERPETGAPLYFAQLELVVVLVA